MTNNAGAWIDLYVAQAEATSPRTPTMFHESAALWLGSVAIARRLVLRMPFDDIYPNLFILWLAPTTLYRKTTALNVARRLAYRTFPHLLTAQETTPEAFLSDMAGREPSNLTNLDPDEQELWRKGRDFAACKGWVLDEMSGLMAASGKDYNVGLTEALLRFYDCEERYRRSTRGQGLVVVRDSCLAMLGASTPAAMVQHMVSERLWTMGFWPRFAILTPDKPLPWKKAWEQDEPPALREGLDNLYKRLDKPVWPYPPTAKSVTLADGVLDAWDYYNKTHSYTLLKTGKVDAKLFGTYGRLPVMALKVAIILAAFDWPQGQNAPIVEVGHMMRAFSICESWRASAHRALAEATASELDRLQIRVLRQVSSSMPIGVSLRDLRNALRDKKVGELEVVVGKLMKLKAIELVEVKSPKGGRPAHRYKLIVM